MRLHLLKGLIGIGSGLWTALIGIIAIVYLLPIDDNKVDLVVAVFGSVLFVLGITLGFRYVDRWKAFPRVRAKPEWRPFWSSCVVRALFVLIAIVVLLFGGGRFIYYHLLFGIAVSAVAWGAVTRQNSSNSNFVDQFAGFCTFVCPPLALVAKVTIAGGELRHRTWLFQHRVRLDSTTTISLHRTAYPVLGVVPQLARSYSLDIQSDRVYSSGLNLTPEGGASPGVVLYNGDWPLNEIFTEIQRVVPTVQTNWTDKMPNTAVWSVLADRNIGLFLLAAPVIVVFVVLAMFLLLH